MLTFTVCQVLLWALHIIDSFNLIQQDVLLSTVYRYRTDVQGDELRLLKVTNYLEPRESASRIGAFHQKDIFASYKRSVRL